MQITVGVDANRYLTERLVSNNIKNGTRQGFFYSDIEKTYVAFDKEFNIEYFGSVSECFGFLKGR